MRKGLLLVAAVALLVGGLVPAASASSTPVACDRGALVQAITDANTDTSANVLSLAPKCTYLLTAVGDGFHDGLPLITDELTIKGNGATILRNSLDAFRIFNIANNVTVSMDHLTIEGGHLATQPTSATPLIGEFGGGIYNVGTLTLTSVNVIGNIAGSGGENSGVNPGATGGAGGGIYNNGTLKIVRSKVSQNASGRGGDGGTGGDGGLGGGIANDDQGSLTIVRSTISDNTAGDGGGALSFGGIGGGGAGIYNLGTLTASRSKVNSNQAGTGGYGGTVGHGGSGGGIYTDSTATTTLTRTTVAHNVAGYSDTLGGLGGGLYNAGTTNLSQSKINSNAAGDTFFGTPGSGGGIFNDSSTMTPSKTKIASNTPDNCEPPGSVAHCTG